MAVGQDCQIDFETSGEIISKENCVNVNVAKDTDTGCVQLSNNDGSFGLAQPDIKTCLEVMKNNRISPVTPLP